jgi:uncharacterized protein YbjQ (UPF0145 family)
MRLPAVAFSLLTLAGCAESRPPTDPSGVHDPSLAESGGHDEAAEERAIVSDPAVIAAARNVRVLENENLGCPSEVLGLVDIHEPVENVDRALEVLKRKAAKIGAAAVIGVEFHHGEPGAEPTHLSGIAVRCNDLLKGRTYSELGRIEVAGKMGDEDDAERELLDRARSLQADLVIGIGFEHGDGEGRPTKVWGTAIRFK